jgi:predicted nuclease of predicted toxin-antitoxin system
VIALLDENFPASARAYLEARGHTVLDVRGTPMEGSPDEALVDLAIDRDAVILTTDRDFFHTLPLRRPDHLGMVVIALKRPNATAILASLARVLPAVESATAPRGSYLVTDRAIFLREHDPIAD